MKETWKPIKNYEGLYEVSNKGQVRSLNYKRTGEIKILKLRVDKYGYLQVHLSKNGKHYAKSIHRLVAQTFIPNPNNYSQVNTGEIFNSIREAGDFCNMKHPSNISECCKGKRKTAGKHPVTGEKLIWDYLMP